MRPPRTLRRPRGDVVHRVTVALSVLLLAAVVFLNGLGTFNTDIKPEVYLAPDRMLARYLSAWLDSPYLGSPNFNVGLVPVLVVTALLRAVGLGPEMAFKAYHLALWLIAAWGASRLLRTLVPRAGRWAGFVAGAAYLANPYAVTAGATLAIALPFALLPWLLLCLVRALRAPSSWAWPAAFGLVFAGMSGMNVAVVPVLQLLAVVPVAWMIQREQGHSLRTVVRVVARCALFVVGLSLYWLLPAISAVTTGSQIVEGSETLDGIAKVSSFVEVLRGLGMWSLYGHSDSGPWIPQHAVYLTSPIVIIITVLWPVLALLALRVVPARLAHLVAATAGMAAVVMVGLFPGGAGSSPFGRALALGFAHIGPMLAFRTTNKIGAVLVLAFALALGAAAVRVLPRMMRTAGVAPVALSALLVLLVGWTAPALTGGLYISELDVPDYWHEAAEAVDAGDPAARVLLLPGQTRSSYRWSQERPDDLPNSLLARDAVIPETTPNTSPWGGNYLAALDDTLQSGSASDSEISTYARYLGADQVLLRHDIAWEPAGGARPAITAAALADDPGLVAIRNFGRPGQNTQSPSSPPTSSEELLLPPVQLYGVSRPQRVVRAQSAAGSVVVSGDGWALAPMARAGMLEDSPAFRYAADLTSGQLAASLGPRSRMVLTDTNQRRAAITNRLTANEGAALAEDEELGVTRTLGTNPDDQTVLERRGVRVRASDQGGAFFDTPYGVPENVMDGDPATSWLFGDFGRAVGQELTIDLPTARRVDALRLTQAQVGAVTIDEVRVRAGSVERTVRLRSTPTTVDLGGVSTDRITVQVVSTAGEGFNLVGLSEVEVRPRGATTAGRQADRAERTLRAPLTLDQRYGDLGASDRRRFAQTPLDVLLTRVRNTADPGDDTETTLRRSFRLPDDRRFRAAADVRVVGDVEGVQDQLAGYDRTFRVRSSRVWFDDNDARASQAADGSSRTAWVPGGTMRGAWWEMTGPRRPIEKIVVEQRPGYGSARVGTLRAARLTVHVDGTRVASVESGLGRTAIPIPAKDGRPLRGRTVRVVIDAVAGDEETSVPARFVTIDTGVTVRRVRPQASSCVTVARIDGGPLRMRPEQGEVARATQPGTRWRACRPLALDSGDHDVEPVDGLVLDGLDLRDTIGTTEVAPAPPPTVRTTDGFASSKRIDVGRASGPYVLSIGQGYDPRWRATANGKDLGTPVVVNGYATGWLVEDTDPKQVVVRYAPQDRANLAMIASLLVMLAALVLVLHAAGRRHGTWTRLHAWWREQRAGLRPADDEEDVTPEDVAPLVEPAAPVVTAPASVSGVAVSGATGAGATGAEQDPDEVLVSPFPGLPRPVLEVLVLAVSGIAAGWAGLAAAALAVLLLRTGRVGPRRLVDLGALLVLLAGVAYVVVHRSTINDVSADLISQNLWPHRIAGAGLVLAVIGGLLRGGPLDGGPVPAGPSGPRSPRPRRSWRPALRRIPREDPR